jgi:3-methyladenine DNA glycosylase Tag
MDSIISRCAQALNVIDAYLICHQNGRSYDHWLNRYTKAPADHDDAFLFGKLVQAMFSGGFKGHTVDVWIPRMESAFYDWDIRRIAELNASQIEEIAASGQVIRNLDKLRAVAKNAATALGLIQQYGSFGRYLMSFPNISALVSDISVRFDFLGDVTTQDFLRNVGFDTAKPDRHITRWLNRMGALSIDASPAEVLDTVQSIAAAAQMTKPKADAIVYLFCADRSDVLPSGICGKNPACDRCPLENLCPRELGAPNGISPKVRDSEKDMIADSGNHGAKVKKPKKARANKEEGSATGGIAAKAGSFAPRSIGAQVYSGMSWEEIIQKNPFTMPNWLDQGGAVTRHRKDQIDRLFQERQRIGVERIRSLPVNTGRYLAFLAIARGLARWQADTQEVVLLADRK